MPLNMTQIAGMTQDQAILEFHKCIAIPSLIILFLVTIITLILTGLLMPYTKYKSNFFGVIAITTILISLSFLIFLILLPNTTQSIFSAVSKTC